VSKTLPSGLAAHYQGDALTTAVAVKITRKDGAVYAYTSHDEPAPIGGTTYLASGLIDSAFESGDSLAVDNLALTTLDDGTIFTRADVVGGLWQNAAVYFFRYNWANLSDGVEPLTAGTIGEVQMMQGQVRAEVRGLQQYLQQPVGIVSSKTCRSRLGDGACTVNLASFTHSGTVTGVTSTQVFTASGLTQAADYFGDGLITWLTGPNTGISQKVKTHATGGVFTLALPMPTAIAIGNTFTAVAGCRKRLTEDCKTKFNNVLNFQGEPHRPGIDELTAEPDATA
jgi:uncharacterized phage protein (TIGR02218 family)